MDSQPTHRIESRFAGLACLATDLPYVDVGRVDADKSVQQERVHMQLSVVEYLLPRSTELIPFPETVMGGSKPGKPVPAPAPVQPPGWWQRYGTMVAAGLAALAIIVTLGFRYLDWSNSSLDDRIDKRIDGKLGPINQKLSDLAAAVEYIKGQVGDVARLQTQTEKLKAVIRLQSPERTMRAIRTEIATAQDNGERVPASDIADFKAALQEISPAAPDYLTTLATVVNYQSYVNQRAGLAPNPRAVSRQCFGEYKSLKMKDTVLDGCILTLAGTTDLDSIVFANSVIRYEGEPISLHNVRFINCNFIIDVKGKLATPARKNPPFLLALLTSPDQKSVAVP